MKKTFTANLNGTVFHIEEDAYDAMQRYLANIRAKFSGSSEAEEIMGDIEARIAELFTERLQGRQAVSMADVDHVKQVMGQPEDYVDGDSGTAGTTANERSYDQAGPQRRKRLFRDPDDKKVAGVLSGLGHYFGIDPLWLRIAFLVFLLAGWGFPAIFYIALWVLVPEANTAAEKLEMQGEPVTVDNIKRMFEEGAEHVKTGAGKMADEAKEMGRKYWSQRGTYAKEARNAGQKIRDQGAVYGQQARQQVGGAAYQVMDAIAKIIGVVLLLAAIIIGVSWIVAFFSGTASWYNNDFSGGSGLMGMLGFLLPSMGETLVFGIALSVVVLTPVLLLMLAASWLMFRVPTPRWLGWAMSLVFLFALVALSIIGVRLAQDFRRSGTTVSEEVLPLGKQDVLRVRGIGSTTTSSFSYRNMVVRMDPDFLDLEGDTARLDWCSLGVEASPDSAFHVVTTRMARGSTGAKASARAGNIRSDFGWQDGALRLSNQLRVPVRDRFRAQHVIHILQVPLGGRVFFEASAMPLMHDWNDLGHDQFELDRDMAGHTWTMTVRGLERTDPQAPAPAPAASPAPSAMEKNPPPLSSGSGTEYRQGFPDLVHMLGAMIRP